MKASRTTLTLLGVLAIVLGLAVFAPPEAVEPATSVALERSVRTAVPAAAAPAPADAAPQLVAGVSGAAAPAPPGGDAQPGADEPRFAARAGETLFGAPRPAHGRRRR